MSSRVLYHERLERQNIDLERIEWVDVEVRSWVSEGMCPDIVIHSRVSVGGERVVDEREVLSYADADAVFIRMGIAKFDALCVVHFPTERLSG